MVPPGTARSTFVVMKWPPKVDAHKIDHETICAQIKEHVAR